MKEAREGDDKNTSRLENEAARHSQDKHLLGDTVSDVFFSDRIF